VKILYRSVASLLCVFFFCSPAFSRSCDVEDNRYFYEAKEELERLGVLSGDFDALATQDTISRAETAALVIRMLRMEDASAGVSRKDIFFCDVEEEGQYTGDILVLKNMGYIQGNGDGTFCPNEPITYEQILKIFVCVLGYGDFMKVTSDAYPDLYIRRAQNLGLLYRTEGEIGAPVSTRTAVKLLYNMLCCRISYHSCFIPYETIAAYDIDTFEMARFYRGIFHLVNTRNKVLLTTTDFETAEAVVCDGFYGVELSFTEKGASRLFKATDKILQQEENILRLVNGNHYAAEIQISAPISSGKLEVMGNFSKKEAECLAEQIRQDIKWFEENPDN